MYGSYSGDLIQASVGPVQGDNIGPPQRSGPMQSDNICSIHSSPSPYSLQPLDFMAPLSTPVQLCH